MLAHDARNDRALTTYSMLRSIVPQISNITGIENEIRARCALGDIAGAEGVANAAPLFSQRLRLLAVLVDSASDLPGVATQPLKDQIHEIATQIDFDFLQKDEVIDIAIDLYPVDHQLALRVLKTAIKNEDTEDSLEIAMAHITIAALRSQQSVEAAASIDDTAPKSSEVLVDERIQKFVRATQLPHRVRTASEVLAYTSNIGQPSERLFILRKWIGQHYRQNDVTIVTEAAITEAISAANFTPTATFYREVLSSLPYAPDETVRDRLVAMVDAQRPVMQAKGPTIEYVRVQLLLASCNCQKNEWERAADRLEELYLDSIDSIDNLETKIACLAWCLAHIEEFDPSGKLETISQFRDLIEEEVDKALSQIFNDCAGTNM